MYSFTDKTVLVLTRGGSFDKIYPEGKGTYEFVFPKKSAVYEIIERMRLTNIRVHSMNPMDSLDMDVSDYRATARQCITEPEERQVIVHGTDGIIEVASRITQHDLPKTIVVTGSSLPACVRGSDADTNFAGAICAVRILPYGVYIHMHGRTFRWDECEKNDLGQFVPLP
ncbi:MAG: hypothetical protein AB202_01160 [Parcubacteria bacterium C7867-007]|nr:MAG: hypothetical protein AB202_01160 [Parcubacteria bacterium C7867-007]